MSEETKVVETANTEERQETMADFKNELEASYKEFDEHRGAAQPEVEGPDAEKWVELSQQLADKTISVVKVKEAVKGGLIAYVDEIRAFIPASQISTKYVEKLEDWVGKTLEVVPITVDTEKKRLVLSGKVVQKDKEAAEKAAKAAATRVGMVVTGVVETIKDYGAFVRLENGLSGLIHVSQISKDRVKSPAAVLKEGQEVTAKIIKNEAGKISLSIKALEEPEKKQEEEVFNYKEKGSAVTGLGDLLKNIKLK